MKSLRAVAYLILMVSLRTVAPAQDGWFFSSKPPIVVRYDRDEIALHFTNTSDVPIHGITLHHGKEHRVIIDTIDPHKTAAVDLAVVAGLVVTGEMTFTCANYSKPMTVSLH